MNCNLNGHGGWLRHVSIISNNGTRIQFPYQLHEFALLPVYTHRNHDFSYWPGFSLNPGLWDVKKIQHILNDTNKNAGANKKLWFNETFELFEQQFSLLSWFTGMKMAYLNAICFKHIGDESSYMLNNVTKRPWDKYET